jgi:hypothetical protein
MVLLFGMAFLDTIALPSMLSKQNRDEESKRMDSMKDYQLENSYARFKLSSIISSYNRSISAIKLNKWTNYLGGLLLLYNLKSLLSYQRKNHAVIESEAIGRQ